MQTILNKAVLKSYLLHHDLILPLQMIVFLTFSDYSRFKKSGWANSKSLEERRESFGTGKRSFPTEVTVDHGQRIQLRHLHGGLAGNSNVFRSYCRSFDTIAGLPKQNSTWNTGHINCYTWGNLHTYLALCHLSSVVGLRLSKYVSTIHFMYPVLFNWTYFFR